MKVDYKKLEQLIDIAKCPQLSEKYAGIAALPLALPKFEPDSWSDFWHIWNDEKDRVWRNHIDRGALGNTNPSLEHTQWDGMSIYELPELYSEGAWGSKICQPMIDANPNFIKNILEKLPFVKIRSVRFWSAHRTIPLHYDGNMPASLDGKLRFPTEIRIMLDDKNPKETFWLASASEFEPHTDVEEHRRLYVKLPSDTNTFAWNNESFLHAADFNPAYRKILVVIKGWIDVARLEPLLDYSIRKYPEYILKGQAW
jgi:hypothetical protein